MFASGCVGVFGRHGHGGGEHYLNHAALRRWTWALAFDLRRGERHGAVVGCVFAKGENSPENKKQTYAIVRELCEKFQAQTGSLICAELLQGMKVPVEVGGDAETRTPEYYKKRSCGDMVALAAEILENYMKERGVLY